MAEVQVSRSITGTNRVNEAQPNNIAQITNPLVNLSWFNNGSDVQAAFQMGSFPSAYLYNALLGAYLKITSDSASVFNIGAKVWSLTTYDPTTLSWNTKPSPYEASDWETISKAKGSKKTFSIGLATTDKVKARRLATGYGVLLTVGPIEGSGSAYFYTQGASDAGDRPEVVFTVDDSITVTSQVVQQNSPTGGAIDPHTDTVFAWKFAFSGQYYCAGSFTQQSATLYWKLSTDANYTAVAASGSTKSVTIPAETFPSGTIQWYVTATDNRGTTTSTPVYSFSTGDATSYAYPESPVSEIVDGSQPITFSWTVENAYGSQPSRSQLAYSEDMSTWTTLTTVSGSGLSYSVPANTLPAGTLYWRVRARNQDAVYGPWSAAATIQNIAAPSAPSVLVNAAPFATITWSANDQQAFRILVDGELIGTFFGSEKRYQLESYLEPGEHEASVAVQNIYGLWSAYGSTSFETVGYTGTRTVTLDAAFGVDAALSWSTTAAAGAQEGYYVYRDGVLIGKTNDTSWLDRLALGTHSYYVVLRISGDRYIKSNTVTGALSTEETLISAVNGESWLALRLSEFSSSEQGFSFSRSYSLRHITAAKLPYLETSPYEDGTGSYSTAFSDEAAATSFEDLRGQVVIMKSRRGNVLVGILAQVEKHVGDFFTTYSFSIQRIHWEGLAYGQNS